MLFPLLALTLTLPLTVTCTPLSTTPHLAPLLGSATAQVSGSYIVVLDSEEHTAHLRDVGKLHARQFPDHESLAEVTPTRFHGVGHVYKLAQNDGSSQHFTGYSLHNVSDQLIDTIRARPEVSYVEHDSIVTTQDQIPIWATEKVADSSRQSSGHAFLTEKSAPWGLARISHRKPLSLGTFNKYVYDDRAGKDVDVFVIDTGINVDHEEFEGRASWGKTIPQGAHDFDGNGHGTHCAGTIGSRKYGVAKAANIHAVKVLGDNGSGSMSDVVAGVLWASQAAAKRFKEGKSVGAIASMSLGGGSSRALDDVINRVVAGGLTVAAAGGNENQDSCNSSPAAAERAVTVGASTLWDNRASFSNWGTCTDIFAPGLNILSTWIGSKSAVNTISGTSMAAPHIAGLLAYILSNYVDDLSREGEVATPAKTYFGILPLSYLPNAVEAAMRVAFPSIARSVFDNEVAPVPRKAVDPSLLKATLLEMASPDLLSDVGEGSPNLLAYNNATGL